MKQKTKQKIVMPTFYLVSFYFFVITPRKLKFLLFYFTAEKTRVRLVESTDSTADYINANYIRVSVLE